MNKNLLARKVRRVAVNRADTVKEQVQKILQEVDQKLIVMVRG